MSNADNNRFTYTGREFDGALGLFHYRARMYDSISGRFCSKDPIGYSHDGFSQYGFYLGLSRSDPFGMETERTEEEIQKEIDELDRREKENNEKLKEIEKDKQKTPNEKLREKKEIQKENNKQ